MSKKVLIDIVDTMFREMEYELIRGNDIYIRNFGTFKAIRVYGGSEIGGMKLVAHDHYRVKFQPSDTLKDRAKEYFEYKEVYDNILY